VKSSEIMSAEDQMEVEFVLSATRELGTSDLMKLLKTVTAELEKKMKAEEKVSSKVVKSGAPPKGVEPTQLRKPLRWVEFVKNYSLQNGWDAFDISNSSETIKMEASVFEDDAWVYPDSNGKQLTHKEAMSLSKQYWSSKAGAGTRKDVWDAFELWFETEFGSVSPSSSTSSTSSSPKRTITAAEKEREKEEKKAEKEREKEEKKAEKEREKEAKKAEKEREKEEKKAEKEREKEEKKAEKEREKLVKTSSKVPIKAVKAAGPIKASAVSSKPTTPIKAERDTFARLALKKKLVAATAASSVWTCPADGNVYPWPYKGKTYLRNHDNEVWERSESGALGAWCGVFVVAEDRIDDSAAAPEFEEDA
jgi:hypothetical protein